MLDNLLYLLIGFVSGMLITAFVCSRERIGLQKQHECKQNELEKELIVKQNVINSISQTNKRLRERIKKLKEKAKKL